MPETFTLNLFEIFSDSLNTADDLPQPLKIFAFSYKL